MEQISLFNFLVPTTEVPVAIQKPPEAQPSQEITLFNLNFDSSQPKLREVVVNLTEELKAFFDVGFNQYYYRNWKRVLSGFYSVGLTDMSKYLYSITDGNGIRAFKLNGKVFHVTYEKENVTITDGISSQIFKWTKVNELLLEKHNDGTLCLFAGKTEKPHVQAEEKYVSNQEWFEKLLHSMAVEYLHRASEVFKTPYEYGWQDSKNLTELLELVKETKQLVGERKIRTGTAYEAAHNDNLLIDGISAYLNNGYTNSPIVENYTCKAEPIIDFPVLKYWVNQVGTRTKYNYLKKKTEDYLKGNYSNSGGSGHSGYSYNGTGKGLELSFDNEFGEYKHMFTYKEVKQAYDTISLSDEEFEKEKEYERIETDIRSLNGGDVIEVITPKGTEKYELYCRFDNQVKVISLPDGVTVEDSVMAYTVKLPNSETIRISTYYLHKYPYQIHRKEEAVA